MCSRKKKCKVLLKNNLVNFKCNNFTHWFRTLTCSTEHNSHKEAHVFHITTYLIPRYSSNSIQCPTSQCREETGPERADSKSPHINVLPQRKQVKEMETVISITYTCYFTYLGFRTAQTYLPSVSPSNGMEAVPLLPLMQTYVLCSDTPNRYRCNAFHVQLYCK